VFAIIQAGGRQVKVGADSLVTVDRLDAAPGSEVTFDRVLFVEKDGGEMLAGAPFVADAKVVGVVQGESRGPKIRVFMKKRRKGQRKTRGHRSTYSVVRVKEILF
jgi:large subunit ribosomal protein L21